MHVHPPQTVAEPRPSDRRRPVRIRSCGTPDGGGSVRIGDAGLSVEAQDACIQTATQTAPPRPDTAHSYPQRAGTTAVWAQGPFCGPAGHRASSTSPSPRIPVPARVQWVVRHLPGRPPRTAGHAPAARGDRDLRGGGAATGRRRTGQRIRGQVCSLYKTAVFLSVCMPIPVCRYPDRIDGSAIRLRATGFVGGGGVDLHPV